jgi:hypothetical protein
VVAAVALAALVGAAAAEGREWTAVRKDLRAAFKPLKLPSAKKLEKQVVPRLPQGIVIESRPFDRLIGAVLDPYRERLDLRESALREISAHRTAEAGKELRTALAVLAKEDAAWATRLAAVEEAYAEVFDKGYMDSGESTRRARKLAAVLIPVFRGLRMRNAQARRMAGEALGAFREGAGLAWLLEAAGDRDPAVRAAVAEGLGRTAVPEAQQALRRLLASDGDPAVRSAALSALLRWRVSDVRDAVGEALGDAAWEVRALAVAVCVRGGIVEAAGPLIEALGREDGRLRTDIDEALHALVGVRFYGDVELWKRWWGEHAAEVAARAAERAKSGAYDEVLGPPESWEPEDAAAAGEEDARGATSAFYGISTRSLRVLFVVDISRSMESPAKARPPETGRPKDPYPRPEGGSKLAVAKWQLHRAISDLPDEAQFNVIVYSESYAVWQERMTPAAKKGKSKAHAFVDSIRANGTTNIGDSLDKAFELAGAGAAGRSGALAADTVFLLSDGNPNRGRIADLGKLLEDVVRRNARARLVIHTVGIGEVAGSSFLESLARRTGGRYVGFE